MVITDRSHESDAAFQAELARIEAAEVALESADLVRISPDGRNAAIRRGRNEWRVTNGGLYRDKHVADWQPMAAITALVDRNDGRGQR